jgi:peptidyl-prolyl cis-trans isomerase D
MLSYMRKHAKSWFIKVLLGTVIVVFIFFYGFSLRERESAVLAKVNGIKIAKRDFQKQWERVLEFQGARGSDMTSEQRKLLRQATLQSLIDQILLLEEAKRWKITVTPVELREQLTQVPYFQENGRFSPRLYQQYLRMRGMNEDEFLRELEKDLKIQRVEQLIRDGAWVSDEEVEALYRLTQEKVVIQYVEFSANSFIEEISPSQQELEAYFKEHLSDYRIPEMVKVEYMRFDAADYTSQVEVTEREIEEAYERNKQRWKEPPQVLARQIFIRSPEREEDKVRMKALEKAEEILRRLKGGEDFAQLAKEHSQDPQTANKGGAWGWKRREEFPEPIARALFDEMKPGELSPQPVKTALGFHVLKLEERKEETIKPLAEVRDELEREIRKTKARQKAAEIAEEAYLEVFQGRPFKEVGQKLGAHMGITEPFPLQGPVKGLEAGEALRNAAFLLREKEDFTEVVQEGESLYILQLVERIPAREPSFEEVKEKVTQDLKRVKAIERAGKEAEKALEGIKAAKSSLASEAAKMGWKLQLSPPAGRMASGAGLPNEMIQEAFSTGPGENLLPRPYRQGDRYLVAEVKERIEPDPKGLEERRPLLRSLLLSEKRESLFRSWLTELRSKAEISTYKALEEIL